jgi:hypothetical protein
MNRKRILWAAIVLFALYGGLTEFTISGEWLQWALVAAPVATLIAIPVLARFRFLRITRGDAASTSQFVATGIVTFLFGLILSGLIVGSAMPAVGTYLLADDERMAVLVSPYKRVRERNRWYLAKIIYRVRITIEPLNTEVDYKIDEDQFPYFEPKMGKTRARIRRSWFGIHVLELEPSGSPSGSTPHIDF